jgi:hypothetical protein
VRVSLPHSDSVTHDRNPRVTGRPALPARPATTNRFSAKEGNLPNATLTAPFLAEHNPAVCDCLNDGRAGADEPSSPALALSTSYSLGDSSPTRHWDEQSPAEKEVACAAREGRVTAVHATSASLNDHESVAMNALIVMGTRHRGYYEAQLVIG